MEEGGVDDEWMSRDFVQFVLDTCEEESKSTKTKNMVDSYKCFSSGVWIMKLKGHPLATNEPAKPILAIR